MAPQKVATLFRASLRHGLDIIVPGQHGIVAFGAKDPRVAAVHGACLATLENELVGRGALGRVGS